VVLGLVLIGAGVGTWLAVRDASASLVRGQADTLHDELRLAVQRGNVGVADMPAVLSAFSDEGLSYLAVVDENGDVLLETGLSVFGDKLPPEVMRGIGVTVDRKKDRVRASYRRIRRPRLAQRLGVSANTRLVFEFVPQEALALEQRATWGVALAGVGAVFALLLALLYGAEQRRAQRAQAAETQSRHLASLGQMSAVLAHELRNPLASLKGHAQLLQRALPPGEPQRAKADLVVNEAVRLERLSGDLLTFARSGELRTAPTDVVALVRSVCEPQPRVTLSAPARESVALDGDRMRQVITNLVDNALQAGDGEVQVAIARETGALQISVRDHGPGIAAADLSRLFEPFFTTKTHGTGLGLAVALHIVQLHGGTLIADNAPGGGARFVVRLPLRKEGS
jgi:two-component system sensor histidine kinase HydH